MNEASPLEPFDPGELGNGIGVVCFPVPGLRSDVEELIIDDLLVRHIDVQSWRLMENNRATDLYTSHYQSALRFYVVVPLYEEDESRAAAEMEAALQHAEDLVLALRLLSDEDVISPRHVVACRRIGGMNRRPIPDTGRSRFLTATFGPSRELVVRDQFTGREWHEDLYSYGGEPFLLPERFVPLVESRLELVRAHRNDSASSSLLQSAIRNYMLGRSRLLEPRQRLIPLFTCLEVLLGGFRTPGKQPSLGALLAALVLADPTDPDGFGESAEATLRPVRNAMAHGRHTHSDQDLDQVCVALGRQLRLVLTKCMVLARSDECLRDAAALDGGNTAEPIPLLRSIARHVFDGDERARELLPRLDLDRHV